MTPPSWLRSCGLDRLTGQSRENTARIRYYGSVGGPIGLDGDNSLQYGHGENDDRTTGR